MVARRGADGRIGGTSPADRLIVMRILAIGDIHGCSGALDVLLKAVQPQPDDLLITLGDYVDRGPDSAGVVQRLLQLRETRRVVSLRGNHELMMLAARRDAKQL